MDAPKSVKNRRVSRARSSLSTLASHNDGEPSSAKRNAGGVVKDEPQSITGSRAVSGATLVEKEKDEETPRKKKRGDQLDIDMHWDMAEDASGNDNADGPKRRASRRSQIGIKAGEAGKSIAEATSSLGKRARDAMDTVKEKASAATTRTTRAKAPESPPKRAKYEPTGRLFPNLPRATPKEEAKEEDNQPKEAPKPVKAPRTRKLYQTQGLYAGQTRTFDPMVKEGTNKKKVSAAAATEAPRENSVLPLPMFGAHKRLTIEETKTTGFAHFKLPFDVLLPLRKEQNPKDWSKLSKSRHILQISKHHANIFQIASLGTQQPHGIPKNGRRSTVHTAAARANAKKTASTVACPTNATTRSVTTEKNVATVHLLSSPFATRTRTSPGSARARRQRPTCGVKAWRQ
jgi:hypothetical protein